MRNFHGQCYPRNRNRLIGYLALKLVIGNLETTDQLTGYSVKVHSTNKHTHKKSQHKEITNSSCQ